LGRSTCAPITFFVSGPKFPKFEVWSCPKSTQILHVFGPQLFWGRAPKFWDVIYHAEEPSDNVAKFRGDWPTELGYLVAKQIKRKKKSNISSKT